MKRTHIGRTILAVALVFLLLGTIALADPNAARPSWSVPEALLRPWTSVTVQEKAPEVRVGIWGREYRFAGAPLPAAVSTAGTEILAGPMRLVGTVDGKPVTWQRGGNLVQRHAPQQAVVCGWQANETLIANTTCATEFDGMMRVGLILASQQASPKLQKLWLEVPLRPERATLYHYWPGRWGSAANSGALPEQGLSLSFHPFVWLGWEDGGLAWFAESDQGWEPGDVGHTIEVVHQEGETVLRVHLIPAPKRLPDQNEAALSTQTL